MEKIKNMAVAMVAIAMIIGFSAFKAVQHTFKPSSFLYELDENGNIGNRMEEADAECDEISGDYCYVELTSEKPSHVQTLNQAITAGIHLNTFYWE